MYFCATVPISPILPRRWRLRFLALWLLRCFLPACVRFSFPFAVMRKRFGDALWGLIFGMTILRAPHRSSVKNNNSLRERDLEESYVFYDRNSPACRGAPIILFGREHHRHAFAF